MDIFTNNHQTELVKQAKLKELYTNEYLSDPKNENFKLIERLFFNGDKDKTKDFNIGSNIFSTITDVIANFVGQPVCEVNIEVTEQMKDLVSIGKGVWGIRRVDGELQSYYIQAKDHIVIEGVDTIFKIYEVKEKTKIQHYLLQQSFYVGRVENKLMLISSVTQTEGKQVPLDTIPQTSGLEEVSLTGIDRPSIFVTTQESILHKIKQLVYSLDRKLVMFETQFLGEMEQFKVFKNIAVPEYVKNENGEIDFRKLGKVFFSDIDSSDADIKIISNKNELISEAINYEQTQLQKVSSTTSIPTDFLGLKSSSAISGTSRELMMQSFIKTIERYRNLLTPIVREILEVIATETDIETGIIWNEAISKGDKELIEELKLAREAGLVSQFTGVKLYLGLDDDKVQEELDRISPTIQGDI